MKYNNTKPHRESPGLIIPYLVWYKATPIPGLDNNIWRKDRDGLTICFNDHGNTNSNYGWEIDHIYPTSLGGPDSLDNLQPLHWRSNRTKGDKFLF